MVSYVLPTADLFLFRGPIDNLTPEERDARTVFCMQLAARIRPRDLEEFFSTVGKVTKLFIYFNKHLSSSSAVIFMKCAYLYVYVGLFLNFYHVS